MAKKPMLKELKISKFYLISTDQIIDDGQKFKGGVLVILSIVIAIAFIGVDQLTKFLLYGKSFSVVGDVLWVESTFNEGAAFGSLAGAKWIFVILALAAIALIVTILAKKKFANSRFAGITFGLLLAGIIGNLIDRVIYSGVRDFIYLKFINFAIFNIADACITFGTIFLIIFVLFVYKPDKVAERSDKALSVERKKIFNEDAGEDNDGH